MVYNKYNIEFVFYSLLKNQFKLFDIETVQTSDMEVKHEKGAKGEQRKSFVHCEYVDPRKVNM